jgi:beta-phosphoglucomutase-like phosphatase (HAD superfamily)
VIAAEDVHSPKPSPEAYQRALERLARRRPARPATTLALEDSAPGVLAARGVKLRCIAVGTAPSFHAVRASAYIPSLVGQSLATLQALLAPAADRAENGVESKRA